MSLNLDKRHRAMLREMGVRVWSPMDALAAVPVVEAAPPVAAAAPEAAVHAPVAIDAVAIRARSAPAAPAPVARPLPAAAPAVSSGEGPAWQVGEALALYADTASAAGPRWLVLAETPASALQGVFNPFDGDAGQLLNNMLRATKLDKAGAVTLAPLARHATAGADLRSSLSDLVGASRPDLVLVMGRLASQALLQTTEPFGKMRGKVHQLHGVKVIVTHDAHYLLRNPLDKGKAWEDLCLAMSVIST
ncbi:MAG: uracil-DNA glycosylase family protein [Pseudomonadota bacterium]